MSVAIEAFPIRLSLSAGLVSELSDVHSSLRAITDRRGSAVTVYVGGEIDAANVPTFRHLLREAAAAASSPGPVVVDIGGLDFMGCCAVTALAEEADRCRRRGVDVRLVSQEPIVARMLTAGGLSSRLDLYPDIDSALSAVSPRKSC
jgi:anti-anti-sigma factor